MIRVVPGPAVAALAYMAGIFWLSSLQGGQVAALGLPAGVADLVHVPLFAGLGSVTLSALAGRAAPCALLAAVVALGFALTDEWHQSFVPERVFALRDLVSDAVGVGLGIGAVLWWRAGSGARLSQMRGSPE